MRIDAPVEYQPEMIARLKLLYDVAATQRANAAEGLSFASIRLDGDRGLLMVTPPGCDAIECQVDYSTSSRDVLRDVIAAQGISLRAAPPDDGTFGMPKDDDPPLLQHAWVMKMVAYGVDPWTVYGRSWAGDLLEIRLAHLSTEALFRIDGLASLVVVNVNHAEPSRRIGLNYAVVDRISRLVDEGDAGIIHL
ncbi:hypothetical protein Aple_045170 [Acrocarpospora pleiomorpha]|uniref:Uncharacterized protein n=1 Tax=Acrocarpospora pleiomorpha TaxID=90975 RepID=A0A5M3XPN9_9ACTN|nr:hypothetical protein [Acrocarpospora pleiomorpha]GES21621.1 hypothetical protein Aple_045170 [Acrocarpospora pleiomorpha]